METLINSEFPRIFIFGGTVPLRHDDFSMKKYFRVLAMLKIVERCFKILSLETLIISAFIRKLRRTFRINIIHLCLMKSLSYNVLTMNKNKMYLAQSFEQSFFMLMQTLRRINTLFLYSFTKYTHTRTHRHTENQWFCSLVYWVGSVCHS